MQASTWVDERRGCSLTIACGLLPCRPAVREPSSSWYYWPWVYHEWRAENRQRASWKFETESTARWGSNIDGCGTVSWNYRIIIHSDPHSALLSHIRCIQGYMQETETTPLCLKNAKAGFWDSLVVGCFLRYWRQWKLRKLNPWCRGSVHKDVRSWKEKSTKESVEQIGGMGPGD